MVYRPSDPLMFGINRDERYYISAERVAAPESVRVEGQDFIAYLEPSPLGVRLARLDWTESA